MAGDLNANLADPEGAPRGEAISDKLVAAGLLDTGLHFLPQRKPWLQDRCTWTMQRYGQEVRSRTDYILRTDRKPFQDVAIQDMHHHSDHYMVLGCLGGEPAKELTDYLCKTRRSPLRPLCRDLAFASDKLFSEINSQIPNPPPA